MDIIFKNYLLSLYMESYLHLEKKMVIKEIDFINQTKPIVTRPLQQSKVPVLLASSTDYNPYGKEDYRQKRKETKIVNIVCWV